MAELNLNPIGPTERISSAAIGANFDMVKEFIEMLYRDKVDTRRTFVGDDFNNIRWQPSGKYAVSNTVTGMPTTGSHWLVESINTDESTGSGFVGIFAMKMSSTPALYYRSLVSGAWSAWMPMTLTTT